MSGYLDRMAASVASHERAIHPVLGSLWAPRRDADFVERSQEVSAQSAAWRGAQAHEPHRMHEPVVKANAELISTAPSAKYAEANIPAMQPLLPQAAQSNASEAMIAPIRDEGRQRTAPSQTDRQRVFAPLIEPHVQSRIEPRVQEAPQQRASSQPFAASHMDARGRQAPLKQAEREPDSIEIHIGRIEVLAAPPQAPREPQRPAQRKSLDLGEYLKRGGRAR